MDHVHGSHAVRTGTLSKSWRYKWTMIDQLVFDEDFYEYLEKTQNEKYYRRIVSRLLHLKSGITKFHLYIEKGRDSVLDAEDISNWILILFQKGILEFTLLNMDATPLVLTTYLFSCLKLIHLTLYNCHFRPMSTFCGFPYLLSLDLSEVVFGSYTCGDFLTRCPLLEILKLRDKTPSEIKRDKITKLINLKVLCLPLCELDNEAVIFQLMGYFRKLQELNLDFWDCKLLADVEMSVPTILPCLKTLRLYEKNFSNRTMVSYAIDLICGSPNLETLLIKGTYEDDVPAAAVSSLEVDFSRMGQLQLREVEFHFVTCIKNEVCLMKSLLACSPLLNKMLINPKLPKVFGGDDGKRKFVKELMLHRASPIAEIVID
ncbi:putative F-box-like domain superfamily protein [Tanacetum coccineum]